MLYKVTAYEIVSRQVEVDTDCPERAIAQAEAEDLFFHADDVTEESLGYKVYDSNNDEVYTTQRPLKSCILSDLKILLDKYKSRAAKEEDQSEARQLTGYCGLIGTAIAAIENIDEETI